MNQLNELTGDISNYRKTGDFDKARELVKKHKNLFSHKSSLRKTYKRLSDLSVKMKKTWLRDDINPDKKKELIDQYTRQRADLVRRVYNQYLKDL
jgi:hypothetical protein